MKKIDELIIKKFNMAAYDADHPDVVLFKPSDVLRIVDELEKLHGVILKMDFWEFRGSDYIQVNSTNLESFNRGAKGSEETIKAARELLKNHMLSNEEFVSLVLSDNNYEKEII